MPKSHIRNFKDRGRQVVYNENGARKAWYVHSEEDSDEDPFEDRISQMRFVSWKDTWEPLSELGDCQEALAAFELEQSRAQVEVN